MADQFTLSVIQAAFESTAQEMFDTLRKTAMSPIIYEVLDVGTGITNAKGELICSGAGIPSFVGVLDKTVTAIINKTGNAVSEGDVFLTNDPNCGAVTHLNDIVVAQPVFWHSEVIAWVASIAHWGDIGGRTPGSMSTDTTEIFAEGLRLPVIRLFEQGKQNQSVFDIISCNSRLPEYVLGDLWAQVSAGFKATSIIQALCEKYGRVALNDAISDAKSLAIKQSQDGLSSFPIGHYHIQEPQDDGSTWSASITIKSDRFIVDLRDAPTQSTGPYNTSRDGTVVACQVFFKALTNPERFTNAGSFEALEVLTTPGTVFHADETAAQAYYFETRIKLIDMLWHCIADALPGRLPVGHFASIFGIVIAGEHPDTNRRYAMVEPQMGGWGATATRAGQNAMFSTNHGDTFNCPVEIAEARYGFEIERKTLIPCTEVSGEYPGGAGVSIRYKLRNKAVLSTGCSHANVPVWSGKGAQLGGLNQLVVHRADNQRQNYRMASGIDLDAGDVVEVNTACGGSYRIDEA